jgi:hypothetical protein
MRVHPAFVFQAPVLKENKVMKKVLLIALALTVCASAALADHFGTYSDQQGMSCALTQFVPFPGQTPGYVIQKNNAGSTGAQFGVQDASGLAFGGYTSNYVVLGTLNNLNVGYPSCIAGEHVLLTLNWFALPGNYTCANRVDIVPATASPIPGDIVIVLCDFTFEGGGSGGVLYVGPDSQACVGPSGCDPTPVAETTWGGVKALYR